MPPVWDTCCPWPGPCTPGSRGCSSSWAPRGRRRTSRTAGSPPGIMWHEDRCTTPAGDGDLVAEALLALGWARLEALGHAAVALARVVPLSCTGEVDTWTRGQHMCSSPCSKLSLHLVGQGRKHWGTEEYFSHSSLRSPVAVIV